MLLKFADDWLDISVHWPLLSSERLGYPSPRSSSGRTFCGASKHTHHHLRCEQHQRRMSLRQELTLSGTFLCIRPEHTQQLQPRAAAAQCRCQRTQHLNKRETFSSLFNRRDINSLYKETVIKFMWDSLIEWGGVIIYYPDFCSLLWVTGWRGMVSPSLGNGFLSILDSTCKKHVKCQDYV